MPAGPDNPWANTFRPRSTRARLRARRATRQERGHESHVARRERRRARTASANRSGYKLIPTMSTPTMLAAPESSVGRRAGFARHNLWVTPYASDERRAAGEYPNQHDGGDGLPRWTAADRSLTDTDVVLWYTFGVTHFVRPGGLAGDAGGVHGVPAQPVRLLRSQPRARPPAVEQRRLSLVTPSAVARPRLGCHQGDVHSDLHPRRHPSVGAQNGPRTNGLVQLRQIFLSFVSAGVLIGVDRAAVRAGSGFGLADHSRDRHRGGRRGVADRSTPVRTQAQLRERTRPRDQLPEPHVHSDRGRRARTTGRFRLQPGLGHLVDLLRRSPVRAARVPQGRAERSQHQRGRGPPRRTAAVRRADVVVAFAPRPT